MANLLKLVHPSNQSLKSNPFKYLQHLIVGDPECPTPSELLSEAQGEQHGPTWATVLLEHENSLIRRDLEISDKITEFLKRQSKIAKLRNRRGWGRAKGILAKPEVKTIEKAQISKELKPADAKHTTHFPLAPRTNAILSHRAYTRAPLAPGNSLLLSKVVAMEQPVLIDKSINEKRKSYDEVEEDIKGRFQFGKIARWV